jgi:hypothetical protein
MTKAQLVDENIRLRAQCDVLEQQLAALRTERPVAQRQVQRPTFVERVVAEYTKRDGTRWAKVRTGWNTHAHRQIA